MHNDKNIHYEIRVENYHVCSQSKQIPIIWVLIFLPVYTYELSSVH